MMAFRRNVSSFSDFSIDKRIEGVDSFLKEIDEVIDFNKLLPLIKRNGIGTKNACGNKAYDPLSMFKVLLLQKFYNLSDEAAQLALLTNILYFRFAGFSVEDSIPDASTIGKFRGSLLKNKLYEKLFDNVNKQLEQQGLIFRGGKSIIVDATLIQSNNISITKASKDERSDKQKRVDEANAQIDLDLQHEMTKSKPSLKNISRLLKKKERNSRTLKNEEIDNNQTLDSKEIATSMDIIDNSKDSYNHKDRTDKEVRTGKHSSRSEYITGYKHHSAVDATSGLIVDVATTFANTPESKTLEPFIESLKPDVIYADYAYDSKEIEAMLQEQRVKSCICKKEKKGMSHEEKKSHRENQKPISKIRAKVEHPFGVIKFQMKYRSSRYIGLLRNHIDFVFLAIASNLKTLAHRRQKRNLCQIA